MINRMQQICLGRLRDPKTEYGHALSVGVSTLTIHDDIGLGVFCLLPIAFVAQGISVPISRGGPPLLYE